MGKRRRRIVAMPACAALVLVAAALHAAPDEEALGKSRGFPAGTPATWFTDESVRVGSFSHLDAILPHHVLPAAARPSVLPRVEREPPLHYLYQGRTLGIDDYLAHQRTTGLLVIKDGVIQVERYQYARDASDRFLSNSMAKSLVSLAVGIALGEHRIRSLDDKAADYVGELADNAYGETTLRNLLRMSSGVRFSEDYDGNDDFSRYNRIAWREGSIAGTKAFGEREAPQGERFHYASIETQVLALVLRAATGGTLADYLAPRLWQPMGAESKATWIEGQDGLEIAAGTFNATLRDYGRLGMLLANDGAAGGRQIVPKDYLIEATDWHRQPPAFAPGAPGRLFGYGYQFWTMPGEARRFALLGTYGQVIYVDPAAKLVLVHTAVASAPRIVNTPMGAELRALWQGLLAHYAK